MFTNYYNLLNISSEASCEEIDFAIEHCTLSKSLVDEIKMVLQSNYSAPHGMSNCLTVARQQVLR